MSQPQHLPFLNRLLVNHVIRTATTRSVSYVNQIADQNYTRSAYILRILRASVGVQLIVLRLCNASSEAGQKQLAVILTLFFTLTPAKKAAFIDSFRTTASMAGDSLVDIALGTTYDQGHVPPRLPP
jgi:hypothetical protein